VSKYSLHQLDLSCNEDGALHFVGSFLNPFGAVLWINKDGTACVLASKRVIVFGRLTLRALNVAGWFNAEAREALFEPGDDASYGRSYCAGCASHSWASASAARTSPSGSSQAATSTRSSCVRRASEHAQS
jgi:hypothetical protein